MIPMKNSKTTMKRVETILRSSVYQDYIEKIRCWEENRRFCRHDPKHFWEVARTAYILYLSGEVDCPELKHFSSAAVKEMIYAAAFLHDIGRFLEYENRERDHAEESAVLARPLLVEAGFSVEEIEPVLSAIAHHRRKDGSGFDLLLYRADKESRPCYNCPALAECKKFSPERPPVITV